MFHATQYALLRQQLAERNMVVTDAGTTDFILRLSANFHVICALYENIYGAYPQKDKWLRSLVDVLITQFENRSMALRSLDSKKEGIIPWYTHHDIVGMSLYADRFAGNIKGVQGKLDYLTELGVNFIHLMPVMQSPPAASDGGYAVSDFRNVDERFGNMDDLLALVSTMHNKDMYLMLDIVLNHTSDQHEWARRASAGEANYQQYYYMYSNREQPDIYDKMMPDIFPDSSPGSFTYDTTSGKWVMTVFNHYQWDLNYTNPEVFVVMLDTILYYANLGVDILRIDAPAFIWKKQGTTCQNLDEAHTLLRLIKQCVQVVAPGMALLGEAIVAPAEIMKYFGTGIFTGRECDVAYNATQMALQWDALATGDVRVMMAAQSELLRKPKGTTWIQYTRCHDDIGLGYDDATIATAGYTPSSHRAYLKQYYAGEFPGSPARGALFGVNPKNNDARISGSLASLCGLEAALEQQNPTACDQAISKLLLLQAHSMFLGGIPMLFYGDECGYTNDYSFRDDPSKSYDNRWMHRPCIDWDKNAKRQLPDSVEYKIFSQTRRLIEIRRSHNAFSDLSNVDWFSLHNTHIAGFVRAHDEKRIACLFHYADTPTLLSWYAFKEKGWTQGDTMTDLWTGTSYVIGKDNEHLEFRPYQFLLLS